MLKLRFSNSFRKDYKLMKKRGYDLVLLDNVVESLLKGEKLDAKYRDHILLAACDHRVGMIVGPFFEST